ALNPALPAAQRAIATALAADDQRADALEAYVKLLAGGTADINDFCQAGYLAALLGHGDRARQIFRQAENKFPKTPDVVRISGWALINLNVPAEALETFRRYEMMFAATI